MELKKALQKALDFEEKGHKLYAEAAAKTRNHIVKKTFSYLADQENHHIEEIRNFIRKEHPDSQLKGDDLQGAKDFFSLTVEEFREKTSASDTDLKAFETALGLEQASYDFYKKELGAEKDPKTIKFFQFLMIQENAHYQLLQKSYYFIKDPVGFYAEAEGWIFEGG